MRADQQIKFRMPATLANWLREQAKRNGASLNSEIVRSIRERMDRMSVANEALNRKSDDGQTLAGPVVAPDLNTDGVQ